MGTSHGVRPGSRRGTGWGIGGLVVAAVLVVAISGPRPRADLTIRPVALPRDLRALDAFLAAAEARVPNLRPGVERKIVWADPQRRQPTSVALVYLHGFSTSRQEVSPLCDQLAANLGANLYYTRLAGHGRDAEAMRNVSVNDWINDAHEALVIGRRLGRHVVLVGNSTGSTLAAWVAGAYPSAVAALLLLSPNLGPADERAQLLLWPWSSLLVRLVVGEYREYRPIRPEAAPFLTPRYPSVALLPMMKLVDLVATMDPTRITAPLLVIYSPDDRVVSATRTKRWFNAQQTPLKRLVALRGGNDPNHHVLAGSASPATGRRALTQMLAFLQRALPARNLDEHPEPPAAARPRR